jgi:hypothetical protein
MIRLESPIKYPPESSPVPLHAVFSSQLVIRHLCMLKALNDSLWGFLIDATRAGSGTAGLLKSSSSSLILVANNSLATDVQLKSIRSTKRSPLSPASANSARSTYLYKIQTTRAALQPHQNAFCRHLPRPRHHRGLCPGCRTATSTCAPKPNINRFYNMTKKPNQSSSH